MRTRPLRVLYQDAKVLAVHKPAGVAMQGQPFSEAGKAWRTLLDGQPGVSRVASLMDRTYLTNGYSHEEQMSRKPLERVNP